MGGWNGPEYATQYGKLLGDHIKSFIQGETENFLEFDFWYWDLKTKEKRPYSPHIADSKYRYTKNGQKLVMTEKKLVSPADILVLDKLISSRKKALDSAFEKFRIKVLAYRLHGKPLFQDVEISGCTDNKLWVRDLASWEPGLTKSPPKKELEKLYNWVDKQLATDYEVIVGDCLRDFARLPVLPLDDHTPEGQPIIFSFKAKNVRISQYNYFKKKQEVKEHKEYHIRRSSHWVKLRK